MGLLNSSNFSLCVDRAQTGAERSKLYSFKLHSHFLVAGLVSNPL